MLPATSRAPAQVTVVRGTPSTRVVVVESVAGVSTPDVTTSGVASVVEQTGSAGTPVSVTTGAVRSVQSIVGALGWRQAAPVLEVLGDVDEAHRESAYDLGGTLAALVMG